MTTFTVHEKLKMILEALEKQPAIITDFKWIICDEKNERCFFPSQIGITKEEYNETFSNNSYKSNRVLRYILKRRIIKLLKKYEKNIMDG